MPKKLTKEILAALKRAGIKIESEDLDKVTETLEDIEVSAEEYLAKDKEILTKDEYQELKYDLVKVRKRAKDAEKATEKAEKDAADLRDAMDSGDSDNARKMTAYKKKLDELEPVVASLTAAQKKTWDAIVDKIPEAVHSEFRFPEKNKAGEVTKELTTDDLIHNTTKLAEYQRIGVIEGGPETKEGEPDPTKPPTAPRITPSAKPKPLSLEQLDGMSSGAKISAGYAQREAPAKPDGTGS